MDGQASGKSMSKSIGKRKRKRLADGFEARYTRSICDVKRVKYTLIWLVVTLAARVFGAGADFPAVYNSERDTNAVLISPGEALSKLQLPPGFKATMFASEPDVQNPIGMAWDGKGRLWVAENYTYAERGQRFDLRLR